jgi:predicted RNA-binding Zn ribbon-like protein
MGFVFVSGRLCLDFLGTLKWRRSQEPEEQLTAPELMSEWALLAGVVDMPVRTSAGDLSRAVELREALYRVVWSRLESGTVDRVDVELLNSYARREPVALELGVDGEVRRRASPRQLLTAVARDALELLASAGANQLRTCSNPECTRLYLDASRGQNRRWCGMAECGNRAKAQLFRQRRRNTAVAPSV